MKHKLQEGWRWYGPNDTVSLSDIRQAGAQAIVTALHHIPHGEVWPVADILERKNIIEQAGLVWSVVESVPVHEAIKTDSQDSVFYLENYKTTLKNLADCGIKTVCYNFMPVLDWTRTQLDLVMEDGSKALNFDWVDLAVFDIYVLRRDGAERSYEQNILDLAHKKGAELTDRDKEELQRNILMGIPGEKDASLEDLKHSIHVYSKIGHEGLRRNLQKFLTAIAEVCEDKHVNMTIHPDDPPFPILGLPRIASNIDDFEFILKAVDRPFNGVCFCTGSLGAGGHNDLPSMLEKLVKRVYFVHLRNVKRNELGSFYEANHLEGEVDMYAIMKILVEANKGRAIPIPYRPDHGHQMLDDLNKVTNPGYSAIGRLRGLAELRGLELGIYKNDN